MNSIIEVKSFGDKEVLSKKYEDMGDQHLKFLTSTRHCKDVLGLFQVGRSNLYYSIFRDELKAEMIRFKTDPSRDSLRFSWNFPKVPFFNYLESLIYLFFRLQGLCKK